jgi:hypothetical protein
MKGSGKIVLLLTIVSIAAIMSGCCCCCGMDGFTSKYKYSVDKVKFPSTITVGSTVYNLISSTTYDSQSSCVNKFISNANAEGFDTSSIGDMVTSGAQATGIYEAKEFIYQAANGDRIKGFVGKSGSPGQLSGAYLVGKQTVGAISDIIGGGSAGYGDESGMYTTHMPNGKNGFATAARDSNMFLFAYSYSGYPAANAGVNAALKAINDAL